MVNGVDEKRGASGNGKRQRLWKTRKNIASKHAAWTAVWLAQDAKRKEFMEELATEERSR